MDGLLLFSLIGLDTLIIVGYVVCFVVLVELMFPAACWCGVFVWVVVFCHWFCYLTVRCLGLIVGIYLIIAWLFVYCVKVRSAVLAGYLLFVVDYFLIV